MEKKRSKGVTIFAGIILALGVMGLSGFIFVQSKRANLGEVLIFGLLHIFQIACGIGLFNLREWARKLTIYLFAFEAIWRIFNLLSVTQAEWNYELKSIPAEIPLEIAKVMIVTLGILSSALPFVIIVFFLTRPKVKEQFK